MRTTPNRSLLATLFVAALLAASCGDDNGTGDDAGTGKDASTQDAATQSDGATGECNALTDKNAIEVVRGEQTFCRYLSDYDSFSYQVDVYSGTAINLHELIDEEITTTPDSWRYQVYGTDGYTFGGFATWTNMLRGYLELTTRRVIFELDQELPHSFYVKDAYRIVLTPAGG